MIIMKKIFLLLSLLIAITIVFNLLFYFFVQFSPQIVRFFGFPYEANFPTWLSSTLLLLSGLVAFQCASNPRLVFKEVEAFKALGVFLVFMSCDETAMIHEYVGPILNQAFFHLDLPKIQWVIILAPPVIAVIAILSFFLAKPLQAQPRACFYIILGTIIFCSGAFAIESSMQMFDYGLNRQLTQIEIFFEESFELIGEMIFFIGLSTYYQNTHFET